MDVGGQVELIERLANLREQGVLSAEEFDRAKAVALRQSNLESANPNVSLPSLHSTNSGGSSVTNRPRTTWAIAAIVLFAIAAFTGAWLLKVDRPQETQKEAPSIGTNPGPLASNSVPRADVAAVDTALDLDAETNPIAPVSNDASIPVQDKMIDASWLSGWWNRYGDPTCDGDAAEEFRAGGGWESWAEKGQWRLAGRSLSVSLTHEREGYSDDGTKLPVARVREGKITAATRDSFNWNSGSETVKFVRCREA